jgi:hypothetical protein
MEPELVEENRIGSVIEHVKRLATMISTAMLSRLVISHAILLTQQTIGLEMASLTIR